MTTDVKSVPAVLNSSSKFSNLSKIEFDVTKNRFRTCVFHPHWQIIEKSTVATCSSSKDERYTLHFCPVICFPFCKDFVLSI